MPQQFSDNNIDKAFREKLGGLRVEPRSRVWYRVSAGLDREAALVAHKNRRVIGVLIGVILLTGIILTAVLDPVATRKKVSNTNGEIPDEKSSVQQIINQVPAYSVAPILKAVTPNESAPSTFNAANLVVNTVEPTLVESINSESAIRENEMMNNECSNSILNLPLIHSFVNFDNQYPAASKFENLLVVYYPTVTGDEKLNSTECDCKDKLYAGANFKLNRTSFADTALAQNTNFVDKFHLKKGVSVYAGYKFTKNISAEVGWNIASNEGQAYGYTSLSRKPGANPTRKDYEIVLRYTQIPVKIRYGVETWSGILKTHVTYSLAVGAMYGKLLRSGFTTSDMDISSRLKKSEIAGIGNASIDIKLFKKFSFSTGIEASYSNNIFLKDNRISPFTAPHNFVVGATAGVKYNFCGK